MKENKELLDVKLPGSWAHFYPSGWMQHFTFIKWFKKFIQFSHATPKQPVLLLLDGHSSHVKNLDVINLAKSNGVVIFCFSPHCTHRLEPIYVGFMNPISHYYTEKINNFQRSGNQVLVENIFSILRQTFMRAAKVKTAVNSFRKTEIYPLNPSIFASADFANLQNPNKSSDTTTRLTCQNTDNKKR